MTPVPFSQYGAAPAGDAPDLAQRTVAAREQERRRIAAELHDWTGANLAAIKLNLQAVAAGLRPDQSQQIELLRESQATLDDTIRSVRDLCGELQPAALAGGAGLVQALRASVARFERRSGAVVGVELLAYDGRCDALAELMLLRLTQEALHNCLKHAQARRVDVAIRRDGAGLLLTITDDGSGFDPDRPGADDTHSGIGLLIMAERAAAAGARLSLQSAPGHGTRVAVSF